MIVRIKKKLLIKICFIAIPILVFLFLFGKPFMQSHGFLLLIPLSILFIWAGIVGIVSLFKGGGATYDSYNLLFGRLFYRITSKKETTIINRLVALVAGLMNIFLGSLILLLLMLELKK